MLPAARRGGVSLRAGRQFRPADLRSPPTPTIPTGSSSPSAKGRVDRSRPRREPRQLADLTACVSLLRSRARPALDRASRPTSTAAGRFYAAYTGHGRRRRRRGRRPRRLLPARPAGRRADPRADPQRRPLPRTPTTTAASSSSAPTATSTSRLGDGGGAGDPLGNGQDTESAARQDPPHRPAPRRRCRPTRSRPATRSSAAPGRDEIWAYGLRNPWRFSFDRADRRPADRRRRPGRPRGGRLRAQPGARASVGGAGANYGWNCREGFIAYPSPGARPAPTAAASPTRSSTTRTTIPSGGAAFGCSIIGGYVVRDPSLGDLYGRYVYTDYCVGEIRSLALPGAAGGRGQRRPLRGPDGRRSRPRSAKTPAGGSTSPPTKRPVYRLGRASAPLACSAAPPTGRPAESRWRRPVRDLASSAIAPGARPAPARAAERAPRLQDRRRGSIPAPGRRRGPPVQLNRGGKRLAAASALDRRCRGSPSTFASPSRRDLQGAVDRLATDAARDGSRRRALAPAPA